MLIGFAGPMGSGKTAASEYTEFPHICSFATPLKNTVQKLFDFSDHQMQTQEGKATTDQRYGLTPRFVLQKFGTEFIRKTVPGLWVRKARDTILDLEINFPGQDIVFDDIRFEDEAQMIRDLGGTVVHITHRELYKKPAWNWLIPNVARGIAGKINPACHISEQPLEIKPWDLRIKNNRDLAWFENQVRWACETQTR